MKFSHSLKLNHIFQRLYRTYGQANGYLVLYARRNRTDTNRVGITVGKKLGHAVVRNRVRRRLREVYRLNEDKFQAGWDIVVVARTRAVYAEFDQLVDAYMTAAQKAGIRPKDIVIALDDYEVHNVTDLTRALRHYKAGDTATVTLLRGGREMTLSITFDERPNTSASASADIPEQQGEMPQSGDFGELYEYFRRYFGG